MATVTVAMSTYAAMNNDAASMIDPDGLYSKNGTDNLHSAYDGYYRHIQGLRAAEEEYRLYGNIGYNMNRGYSGIDRMGWMTGSCGYTRAEFWAGVTNLFAGLRGEFYKFSSNGGGGFVVLALYSVNLDKGINGENQSASKGSTGWKWKPINGVPGAKARTSEYYSEQNSYGLPIIQNGISIEIQFDGDSKGLTDLRWIQNMKVVAFDFGEPTARDGRYNAYPFYWNGEDQKKMNSQYGTKMYFEDGPGKDYKLSSYSWEAELSLVGKRNGHYVPIFTVTWGYIVPYPDVVCPYPVLISTPSKFQQNLINNAK